MIKDKRVASNFAMIKMISVNLQACASFRFDCVTSRSDCESRARVKSLQIVLNSFRQITPKFTLIAACHDTLHLGSDARCSRNERNGKCRFRSAARAAIRHESNKLAAAGSENVDLRMSNSEPCERHLYAGRAVWRGALRNRCGRARKR